MSHQATSISLLTNAVRIADTHIDVLAANAAAKFRELLGLKIASHSFRGTTRTAELLRRGVILLTEGTGTRLLSLHICFDAQDGSLYSAFPEVPVFPGAVECAGHRFVAGESEAEVRRVDGVHGFAGHLNLDLDGLHVGFHFKKPRDKFGKRVGERRLVVVVAEWGGVKGFADTAAS